MWRKVRTRIICLDCVSYCEGHFQCLLKLCAYDLRISPLALKCANDILCTGLLTLSPLAKVWMVISLLALTCDFTSTHAHAHTYIIGTHSIGFSDLWPLSLLCCHLSRIDFFSSFPPSLLFYLPPNVSLLLMYLLFFLFLASLIFSSTSARYSLTFFTSLHVPSLIFCLCLSLSYS